MYLRFFDRKQGALVPTPGEIEALAARELQARLNAEAEVERLRAELDALRNR